jgi:hypothetical protein
VNAKNWLPFGALRSFYGASDLRIKNGPKKFEEDMQYIQNIASTIGATIGLVIACSIFLQMITTKFIAVFDRYRALTGEYRDQGPAGKRKESLEKQIDIYYRRCHKLRLASDFVTYSEFAFVATIIFSGLGTALPNSLTIKILASATLLLGLAGLTISAWLEASENNLNKYIIDTELHDFPQLPANVSSAADERAFSRRSA